MPEWGDCYSLMEARIVIEQWRQQYNRIRPHAALEPVSGSRGLRENSQPPRLPKRIQRQADSDSSGRAALGDSLASFQLHGHVEQLLQDLNCFQASIPRRNSSSLVFGMYIICIRPASDQER